MSSNSAIAPVELTKVLNSLFKTWTSGLSDKFSPSKSSSDGVEDEDQASILLAASSAAAAATAAATAAAAMDFPEALPRDVARA